MYMKNPPFDSLVWGSLRLAPITATQSAHFLTNEGSVSIVRSPALSSSLRQLDTSDMRLKEVQVASYLFEFLLGKIHVYTATAW